MKQKFDVTGMSCSACSAHVEKAVSRVPGVDQVQVNLLQNSMVVEYEDGATDAAAIIHAVEDAGYGASVKDTHEPTKKAENDLQKRTAEEAKKDEASSGLVYCIFDCTHVHFHGTYAGMAIAGHFTWT